MIKLSIRRPVAIAMAYASVAALGTFAWRNIPIELYPNTQLPRLTVNASWPGASPQTVEAFLTSPLEAVINQVRGVENIISDSEENSTRISIEFEMGTDMDFARLELSERLASIEEELPPAVRSVEVQQWAPREFEDQFESLLMYTFTGPYTQEALFQHLEDVVAPELAQVPGVADVVVSGGRDRVLQLRVDERKLSAFSVSAGEIQTAVQGLDLVQEAGAVRSGDREVTITITNRPESTEEVLNAVVAHRNGDPVRISDLATVHDTFEESRSYSRINGSPSLTFRIYKEDRANAVEVADATKERVAELDRINPYGSRFILNEDSDRSQEIRKQLLDLRTRAMIAAVVIFLVLLLFLASLRSAAVVFATIAFSVLIAINLIYFGGLSLNLLTLMGLAMGFGLIVDNSIVVLENVFRRWQGGEGSMSAAEGGAKEVVLPILASTATTLIVFVPFVYLQGELRLYYVPLAVVVVLTLIASLFVAFTFIPAVAARILTARARGNVAPPGGPESRAAETPQESGSTAVAGVIAGLTGRGGKAPIYVRFYRELVGFNLRHPWFTVAVTLVCLMGSWHLFDKYVTRGRTWGGFGGGQSTYIDIRINLPRGSNLERSDQLARFFEEKLKLMREVDGEVEQYVTSVSATSSQTRVTFPDELEFTSVPVAIKDLLYAYSLSFTGVDVRVYGFGPSFYGGGGSSPNYRIEVKGYNYEKVREIAEDLGRRLEYQARIQDVDTNSSGRFTRDKAVEFVVHVDRAALARYGLTVADLRSRIGAFTSVGPGNTTVKMAGDDLRLDIRTKDQEDLDVQALRDALLPGAVGRGGQSIRLGDVVTIESREVLNRIHRENQQYHRTVAYEFRGSRKLGDVIRDQTIDKTTLPPGYEIEESSGFSFGQEEQNQIFLVLAISILLVYMVTAALFESLRQPLCVLLTVPMALIGVFMIFFYAEATFTREAYIGVIMMGGIVVNNAILLVDHVNRVRKRAGLNLEQAILQGTLERVRPILMTTSTTVLGLLPLVLFSETADANIWNALGFALIGGLLSSTLFVLTTTPAVYLLFERGKARRAERLEEYMRVRATGSTPGDGPGGDISPEPQLA